MEFLFTYGWAIFLLLLATAFLFTSGLLSPNRFISEECVLSPNFPCEAVLVNDGGQTRLLLRVVNGFSYPVRLNEIVVKTAQDESFDFDPLPSAPLDSGDRVEVEGRLSRRLEEGVAHRFMLNLTYQSCAPELGDRCGREHFVVGRIVGRVVKE